MYIDECVTAHVSPYPTCNPRITKCNILLQESCFNFLPKGFHIYIFNAVDEYLTFKCFKNSISPSINSTQPSRQLSPLL